MPDFDINSVLSQFGGEPPKSKVSTFDIDSILKSFGSVETETPKGETKKVVIRMPKPPISGISQEASDELNQTRIEKFGGENPRSSLPTTSIIADIIGNAKAGKEMVSSGIDDISSSKPASGVGKVALGALQSVTAPVTGLIEGGISKPIADITGSKDIGDRAGFVVGSAIPVVPGAGAVVKALPKNKMLSRLVEHIGPENLPSVVAQMKANPRLAPADLSPKVLQSTQELFANGGPQVNYLKNTSDARMASSKDTVRAIHGADIPVDTVAKLKELSDAAKSVGTKEINPAIKGAGPVDISNSLAAIDDVLKPGVLKVGDSVPLTAVKKELESIRKSLRTSKEYKAEDLHSFQSGLRRTAESLLKSATGGDREMGHALMNVRNNLVDDIDKASGGKYKPALSKFRDEKHIAESFTEGYEGIFTNSKKMENRPEHTEAWFKGLTDQEKEAVREGTRARMDTEIGVAKNGALAGESVTRSDFNRDKLKTILGEEEATKRITALEHERTIADTHTKIVGGSQTAMRSNTKDEWKRPEKAQLNNLVPYAAEALGVYGTGIPAVGALAYQGLKGANSVAHKIKTAIAMENEARYAKYALPTEGPSRDELIKALEARIPGPKQSLLTRGANSLSRIVSP